MTQNLTTNRHQIAAWVQTQCGAGECCGKDLDDEKSCTGAVIANGDVTCQWCATEKACAIKSFFGIQLKEMDGAPMVREFSFDFDDIN